MQSITPDLTQQQGESLDSFHMIDHIDQFDKLIGQARSVVSALLNDDAFERLSSSTVADLLWLVGDRLDDMAAAQRQFSRRVLQ